MPGLTCNSCNKEFDGDLQQKLHYKSEWHRYNLKRKVAGVPGVTEALFLARQAALANEHNKSNETPMMYSCALCAKGYRSVKAHGQHLKSKSHLMRASQSSVGDTVIKPLPTRAEKKPVPQRVAANNEENEESEDEWEEVNAEDYLVNEATDSLTQLKVDEDSDNDMDDDDDEEELEPSCCFMCDRKHEDLESCMVHMHKQHGFFIPDIEYLKDPEGLLIYLGLKVKRDFMCLYCNERCHSFNSIEAVRKHMEAKGHCKVHYGDGGDDEEAELEEFYDYSHSYADGDGKQLITVEDMDSSVELGSGGAELVLRRNTDDGISTKTLGSREFMRYYRQKPRPSPRRDVAIAIALAKKYRSMGLATVQSKQPIVRMKVLREMNRSGVEAMRSKMGMKSNVIRNLPNNVTY